MFKKKQPINFGQSFREISTTMFCPRKERTLDIDNCEECLKENNLRCVNNILTEFRILEQELQQSININQTMEEQNKNLQQEFTETKNKHNEVIKQKDTEIQQLQNKVEEKRNELDKTSERVGEIQITLNKGLKELETKTNKSIGKLQEQFDNVERTFNSFSSSVDKLSSNIEDINEKVDTNLGNIADDFSQLTEDYTKLKDTKLLFLHKCFQCGHKWKCVSDNPQKCPNCQSKKWNKEKKD